MKKKTSAHSPPRRLAAATSLNSLGHRETHAQNTPAHKHTANTDSLPNSLRPPHHSHYRGTSNSAGLRASAWRARVAPSPRRKTFQTDAQTVPSSLRPLSETADVQD